MSDIRKLRDAVNDLADVSTAELDDEAWYDRLWKLLDPVIDARAGQALATAQAVMPDWTSDDDGDERQLHVHDAGEYRDPSTGEVDVEGHRFSFEGSTTLLARHLVDDHDVLPGAVEPWSGGLTESSWVALDDLHRAVHAHET